MIVLQHVNSNYGIKTVTRISPYHFAYTLPKCRDLLFLFVDCNDCRIQEIMFWLVDTRLHFYFAVSDLFLGLGHSDYICTGQAKRHVQDQRHAGKVELKCFVKTCFIFIEILNIKLTYTRTRVCHVALNLKNRVTLFCLVLFICLGSNVHIYTKDQSQ